VKQTPLPYLILVLVVVISPLFFGAVYPWGYVGMALCAGTALLLLLVREFLRPTDLDPRAKAILPAIVPYALVLLWALVQCAPGLAIGETRELWLAAAETLAVDAHGSISINPSLTLYAIVRWAAYGCIFLGLFWYARRPDYARRIVAAVAAASVVYAAYGLVVYFSGSETILWYRRPHYQGVLTGVFVNRNNFGAYAGIGLTCCIVLLHWRWRDGVARTGGNYGWAPALGQLLVLPNASLLIGCLVLATALLLTQSRASVATTMVGLFVFALCVFSKRGVTRLAAAAIVLLAVVASGFVVQLSASATMTRIATALDDLAPRVQVYELSLAAVADRPIVGFGLGTFEDVFRLYRTPAFPDRFGKAHNSYLELAVELGLPATLLFMFTLAVLVHHCLRGVVVRRWDVAFPALGLALTVQMGLHSLVDFPLQLPAVAATYAALLATAVAQSRSRSEGLPAMEGRVA